MLKLKPHAGLDLSRLDLHGVNAVDFVLEQDVGMRT